MNTKRCLILIPALLLPVISVIAFFCIEQSLFYNKLNNYLAEHAITDDLSFSAGRDSRTAPVATGDPSLFNVYVPSETSDSLIACFSHFKTLVLDGHTFRNDDDILAYISDGGTYSTQLVAPKGEILFDGYMSFYFLDNLPSLYITVSGNALDTIGNVEYDASGRKPHMQGIMTLVTADGTTDSSGDISLSRRGNTTFSGYDMKPYNMNLDTPQRLLGMPSGRKWALKANAMDRTQLMRNAAAFRASEMSELSPCPASRYVDLYINGEYKGLYMLIQRVAYDELMSMTPGEYLLELDYRYEDEPHYFLETEPVVVHYPKAPTEDDLSFISSRYAAARSAILDDGDYEDYIDVDSFVKMYLIQDFFSQTDVDFASFYFYLGKDGLFHAGPVWDFDLSCGMTAGDPYHEELTVRSRLFISQKRSCVFLDLLEHSDRFMDRVRSCYLSEFGKNMTAYMSTDWDTDTAMLERSAMISALANGTEETGRSAMDDPAGLAKWIERRLDYLDGYYSTPDDYAMITWHFGWGTVAAACKKGEPLGFLPDDMHEGNDDGFWGEITGFADEEGNAVDDGFIPSGDTDLYAVYTGDSYAWSEYSLP